MGQAESFVPLFFEKMHFDSLFGRCLCHLISPFYVYIYNFGIEGVSPRYNENIDI